MLRLIRNLGMAFREANREIEEMDPALEKVLRTVQEIAAAARGIEQLADAFGKLDEDTRRVVRGLTEMASGIAQLIATGGASPGAWIQTVGGVVNLMTGAMGRAGDPEAERRAHELRQAMVDLTLALRELKEATVVGPRVSPDLLAQAIRYIGGPDFMGMRDPTRRQAIHRAEIEAVLKAVGKVLGEDVWGLYQRDPEAALRLLLEVWDSLGKINLETLNGQLRYFQTMINMLDLKDVTDQFEFFIETVLKKSAPAFAEALAGFDLTTADGRRAAREFVAGLFEALAREGVVSEQISAIFGTHLTFDEIAHILSMFVDFLDRVGEEIEGQSYVRNVQITEARAARLLAMQATQLSRIEMIHELAVERNLLLAGMANAMTATTRVADPAAAAATTVGGLSVTINSVNVSPKIVGEPTAEGLSYQSGLEFGRGVGDATALQISRELARLAASSSRAMGSV